jgi:hypothetical protein
MYSLDLPMQTLIELSDVLGLNEAWDSRVEQLRVVTNGVPLFGVALEQKKNELSELKKKAAASGGRLRAFSRSWRSSMGSRRALKQSAWIG